MQTRSRMSNRNKVVLDPHADPKVYYLRSIYSVRSIAYGTGKNRWLSVNVMLHVTIPWLITQCFVLSSCMLYSKDYLTGFFLSGS